MEVALISQEQTFIRMYTLYLLKATNMTAADDKFCNIIHDFLGK